MAAAVLFKKLSIFYFYVVFSFYLFIFFVWMQPHKKAEHSEKIMLCAGMLLFIGGHGKREGHFITFQQREGQAGQRPPPPSLVQGIVL